MPKTTTTQSNRQPRTDYYVDAHYYDEQQGRWRWMRDYRVRAYSTAQAKSEACRLGGYAPDEIVKVTRGRTR